MGDGNGKLRRAEFENLLAWTFGFILPRIFYKLLLLYKFDLPLFLVIVKSQEGGQ